MRVKPAQNPLLCLLSFKIVFVYACVYMRVDSHMDQRCWIPLDLELQAVTSHLACMLEPTSSPKEEQCVLLTADPPLQHMHLLASFPPQQNHKPGLARHTSHQSGLVLGPASWVISHSGCSAGMTRLFLRSKTSLCAPGCHQHPFPCSCLFADVRPGSWKPPAVPWPSLS